MSQSSPPRTLIFDLDGTLIDSSDSILTCFAAALATHGIDPQIPLTAAIIGPPLRATFSLLADTEEASLIERLANTFMAHYDVEGYKATRVYPGIPEMLERQVSAGIALHLATNKRQQPTRLILAHLGWSDWFSSVYSLDSAVPAYADKTAMIAHLLHDQAITPGTAAYVGDRAEDGYAADANGLAFFAANWGYGPFQKQGAPRTWTLVDAPRDLLRVAG